MMAVQQELVGKVRDVIVRNKAFINPYTGTLSSISSSLSRAREVVMGADPLSDVGINASTILSSITSLENTVGRYLTHTNNMSGVGLTNGFTGANFATISQVVSTVQKYSNDGGICEVVYGVFGAIVKASMIIRQIENVIGQLNNLLNSVSTIASKLLLLQNLLESQIEQDLLAFANAQILALQNAAANAIANLTGSPCIGDVIGIVGSAELKKIVNPAILQTF